MRISVNEMLHNVTLCWHYKPWRRDRESESRTISFSNLYQVDKEHGARRFDLQSLSTRKNLFEFFPIRLAKVFVSFPLRPPCSSGSGECRIRLLPRLILFCRLSCFSIRRLLLSRLFLRRLFLRHLFLRCLSDQYFVFCLTLFSIAVRCKIAVLFMIFTVNKLHFWAWSKIRIFHIFLRRLFLRLQAVIVDNARNKKALRHESVKRLKERDITWNFYRARLNQSFLINLQIALVVNVLESECLIQISPDYVFSDSTEKIAAEDLNRAWFILTYRRMKINTLISLGKITAIEIKE